MEASPPTLEERLAAVEERLGIQADLAAPMDPVDELIESLVRQAVADRTMVEDLHDPGHRLVPLRQLTFHRGGDGPVLVVPTGVQFEDPAQRREAVTHELEARREELAGYLAWQPPQVVA